MPPVFKEVIDSVRKSKGKLRAPSSLNSILRVSEEDFDLMLKVPELNPEAEALSNEYGNSFERVR